MVVYLKRFYEVWINTLMKKIIVYLIVCSLLYLAALAIFLSNSDIEFQKFKVGLICVCVAGLGGCLYCLRAVYLNAAVRNQWDTHWHVWYVLRPVVSGASGAVSFLFLKAGLLVLESGTKPDASELGFYALAFVAGFNVDKFIKKLEDLSEAIWGIEKSRAGQTKPEEQSIAKIHIEDKN